MLADLTVAGGRLCLAIHRLGLAAEVVELFELEIEFSDEFRSVPGDPIVDRSHLSHRQLPHGLEGESRDHRGQRTTQEIILLLPPELGGHARPTGVVRNGLEQGPEAVDLSVRKRFGDLVTAVSDDK